MHVAAPVTAASGTKPTSLHARSDGSDPEPAVVLRERPRLHLLCRAAAHTGKRQLIPSVRLAQAVLHGPSRFAAVPCLESTRPIISASTWPAVRAIGEVGRGSVGRAVAWRRRSSPQFDTQRRIRVGCTPIDYGCLDLLPRNPSRIAFNVVQNIAAWRRTLQLWRCNGRQCGGRS